MDYKTKKENTLLCVTGSNSVGGKWSLTSLEGVL